MLKDSLETIITNPPSNVIVRETSDFRLDMQSVVKQRMYKVREY